MHITSHLDVDLIALNTADEVTCLIIALLAEGCRQAGPPTESLAVGGWSRWPRNAIHVAMPDLTT